jgi:hypothetical protein
MIHVLWSPLRDFPVLTIQTPEVATRGGDGENQRSGVEMIQGLLFDRIDVNGAGVAVGQGIELPTDVHL